jgi:hypothetical protein
LKLAILVFLTPPPHCLLPPGTLGTGKEKDHKPTGKRIRTSPNIPKDLS